MMKLFTMQPVMKKKTKTEFIRNLAEAAEVGEPVSEAMALDILNSSQADIPDILAAASQVTNANFSGKISLCSIINAKSGACSEDCSFCAQSVCHQTKVDIYDLKDSNDILLAEQEAEKHPISHFGIVTSGSTVDGKDFDVICETVKKKVASGVEWCASLGSMTLEQFKILKEAGLSRFHHNLETAESYFPSICTTHSYNERVQTIRDAKAAGLEICCGGIFGLGESPEQRVEFASILQREEIDSIPLNYLVPVAGTGTENVEPIKPLDVIRSIAMVRMMNPSAEIKVCAGRVHLRDIQSMIFYAGATGMMIGDLLTLAGRDVKQDLQMLDDLEVDYAWREVD